NDTTCLPDYFLPRLSTTQQPRVVLCYRAARLVGVVYTAERTMAGLGIGWHSGGDAMGRGLVLAAPGCEAEVLSRACDYLLSHGSHALRFHWQPSPDEPLPADRFERAGIQASFQSEDCEHGDWLPLAPTYEAFHKQLGSHTRRNLRYYRRKTEELGYEFRKDLSLEEYLHHLQPLNRVADFPSFRERDRRDRRFFQQFRTRLLVGLADAEGRFVSLLAAVRSGNHLHVLTQLNDLSLRRLSLSVVLRSYLIEHAIGEGVTDIHFMNGASPMLGRFCGSARLHRIALDRRHSLWHPLLHGLGGATKVFRELGYQIPLRLNGVLGSYLRSDFSRPCTNLSASS
ncbi:MAG: family N-acetyltransferase, partial [Acidobacteriaceae bacterium]|nr:family N-acetyltransferase [Acidobacteriaceae bacterium]